MSKINGYKKTLLGLNATGAAASTYFLVNPTRVQTREKMAGALISNAITSWLIWKA